MPDPLLVDLFAEDHAHQALLEPLIFRLCREEGRDLRLRVRSARGGHPRVLAELVLYQRSLEKLAAVEPAPDVVVVAIDANCETHARALRNTEDRLATPLRERAVIACPDPHIERWFLADPAAFARVVGLQPVPGRRKCVRDHCKDLLARAIVDAGHPPTLGGIEFARELAREMDLYLAGEREPSLGRFLSELRGRLRIPSGTLGRSRPRP